MEKDEITIDMINAYKAKDCEACDFSYTSFCGMSNDDIRDCIIIDSDKENDLKPESGSNEV
jgi:hypothetical protein